MFTARATTSNATTSDIASSTIIKSLAHDLMAETSRRTEGSRSGEREVEVVEEFRIPAGLHAFPAAVRRSSAIGLPFRSGSFSSGRRSGRDLPRGPTVCTGRSSLASVQLDPSPNAEDNDKEEGQDEADLSAGDQHAGHC
jgi:hypothetical protein